MKKCAFCHRDAVERGGEHAFDDWLNRWLPVSGYISKYSSITTGESRQYKSKQLNTQLAVVCESCNCGWMSQVTQRIKETFAYVIRDGAPLCILPSGIALLASFTMMKAVCFNHEILLDGDEPFFTRATRERLARFSEIPVHGVRMWMGAFQGESLHSTKSVSMLLSSSAPALQGLQYFAFTYVIGQLVLQLCAARWQHVQRRGQYIIPMLVPDPYWDQATIGMWPTDGRPIEWPPAKYFGDNTIQEFIDRFKLPIRLT